MKLNDNEYFEPSVNIVEVYVEAGFAYSEDFQEGGDGDLEGGGEI